MQCAGLYGLVHGQTTSVQSSASPAAPIERFARPALDTDEGGLWALMDREETRLRRSSFVIKDAELQRYLTDLTCKLAGGHCPDVRVHLVRTPLFNANMAPNGMMQVWTGLLLRMENEAQLAAVLGHELGHYLERHSVEQLRDMKSRAAFAQFLGLFGAIGSLGQMGVLAGAFAFSREHETRADKLGMQLMQTAGYDGKQAAQVWDNLLGELKVTGGLEAGKRSPMLASHPPVETRRDDLLKLAGEKAGTQGTQTFQSAMQSHRFDWLLDELKRGQFDESLILLTRLIKIQPADAQLLFARGEAYRLRARADEVDKCLADFAQAIQLPNPPALTYRSLGLLHKQQAQPTLAADHFAKYLATAPQAPDAGLIQHYIKELTP